MARGAALWFVLTGRKVPNCSTCGAPLNFSMWIDRRQFGYKLKDRMHCSCKCAGADTEVLRKRFATNLQTYGHVMPQGNERIKAKFKRTMLKRHGVEWAGQNYASREKLHETCIAKYGAGYKKKFAEKAKKTNLSRYGVESFSQKREWFESIQSGYQIKEFTLDGKVFRVRGAEPTAIKLLHKTGVPVKNILTTAVEGVPSIPWKDGDARRMYHPDFKVKLNGKWVLIEVKSTYTCGLTDRRKWQANRKKFQAASAAGFDLKLMLVHNGKAKLIDEPGSMTLPNLRRALGPLPPRSRQRERMLSEY